MLARVVDVVADRPFDRRSRPSVAPRTAARVLHLRRQRRAGCEPRIARRALRDHGRVASARGNGDAPGRRAGTTAHVPQGTTRASPGRGCDREHADAAVHPGRRGRHTGGRHVRRRGPPRHTDRRDAARAGAGRARARAGVAPDTGRRRDTGRGRARSRSHSSRPTAAAATPARLAGWTRAATASGRSPSAARRWTVPMRCCIRAWASSRVSDPEAEWAETQAKLEPMLRGARQAVSAAATVVPDLSMMGDVLGAVGPHQRRRAHLRRRPLHGSPTSTLRHSPALDR